MELSFKTNIEVEIDHDSVKPKGFDYESRRSYTDVLYKVALETADWGIKNISYYGINQKISCSIELMNEESEETETYLFKIEITEIETEAPTDFINRDLCGENLSLTIVEVDMVGDEFVAKATAVLTF